MNIHKNALALAAALTVTTVVDCARAALVIYEPFAQTTGALTGKPGGTGTTGNWTKGGGLSGDFQVTTTGLSYGSQPTSGGAVSFVAPSSGTGNISQHIAIPSATLSGLLDDGDVLWFSVLQRTTNNAADDRFAFALSAEGLAGNTNFANGAAADEGIGFAMTSAGLLSARVSTDNAAHVNGATINRFGLAETILIVGKITWGATDTVELFLPDINLNLGAVQSTATAAVSQSLFDTLTFHTRLQGATSPGNTNVGLDEIRFGTQLADVLVTAVIVPEPATATLGLLAAGGLMLRRRRTA